MNPTGGARGRATHGLPRPAHVQDGAELLAGLVQGPIFGPLVAFGPGGVLAELIGEASFRIAADGRRRPRARAGGHGGAARARLPPLTGADAEALVDIVLRLSRLGEDAPEVAELDLNPVLALPDRCVVVDARVRVRRPEPSLRVKSW